MTIRAIIDPNVIISAMLSKSGTPAQILAAAVAGNLLPIVSPRLAAELDEASTYPKIRRYVSPLQAFKVRALFYAHAEIGPDPTPGKIVPLTRDPRDDYLVRLYRHAGADWLISGDKDLHAAELADVQVLTPRQALDALSSQ